MVEVSVVELTKSLHYVTIGDYDTNICVDLNELRQLIRELEQIAKEHGV